MTDAVATDVLEHVKRRMQGMWPKIWKVRAWVNRKKRNGDLEQPHHFSEVFLTESAARRSYGKQLNEIKTWSYLAKHSGKAEFFIPHVFDDGSLAYWPDHEEFIENYEFGF